ncbi:TonB-dependent receptor domain-containing protein [Marinomonas sp.]|uniref:TonB-dependent receptor n=1 Tax=Marinomonas sp. TaxID=1904862 RepID=UPI003A8FC4D1
MKQQKNSTFKPLMLAIPLSVYTALYGVTPAIAADSTTKVDIRTYSIPAGSLDSVLNQFALAADVSLSINSALTAGKRSSGLNGDYTQDSALDKILANTNLVAQQNQNGSYIVKSEQSNDGFNLSTITIEDNNSTSDMSARDQKGYDDVYDRNSSTAYVGKTELERFKGSSPSDMITGMLGVYSADGRNSGGLDPNIRGVQGPGRVPVTIDGTEQAITIYRGYNGANNRSYIDPNMISSIQAIKGPSLEKNVHTGSGGAIVANTLSVDDIVKPGKTVGGEIKVEGSNNAVSVNEPSLSTGQSYLDIPGFGTSTKPYDPTLQTTPRSGGQNSFNDYAYRLAVGTRQDHIDVIGAYAYRKKGNHFSGKKEGGFYSRGSDDLQNNMIPDLANIYEPGDEIPNTSSEMESYLTKIKLKFDKNHNLEFGYRDSSTLYGEIMPSRIPWEEAAGGSVPQWPLSKVDSKAYNLEYNLNPENNDLLNLHANIWETDTVSNTYTSGGYPNDPYDWDENGDTTLRNTAVRNANESRKGITLSNTFVLRDNLDLTLGGRYQHETLNSADEYGDPEITGTFRALPQAGRREETEFDFNFNWRPTNALTIDAGMRYQSFWSFDDLRQSRIDAGDSSFNDYANILGRNVAINYDYEKTQADVDSEIAGLESQRAFYEMFGIDVDALIADKQDTLGSIESKQVVELWEIGDDGKYSRDNHPCLTTNIDLTSCNLSSEIIDNDDPVSTITKVKKHKGDGWAPSLGLAFDINDDSRVYARHSQAYRFPSLFENTVGFSASLSNPNYELKPEHIYNYEVGYVQNLTKWIDAEVADVKLSYYYNRTENIIERDTNLNFSNLEKQTLEGIELQGRYDTGRFFTDLSIAYNFRNEVCDESSAVLLDYRSTSNCVDDGFVGGYLVSMATPVLTTHLTLGARYFERKLEIGSRFTYYSSHEDRFNSNYENPDEITYFINTPLSWDEVLLVDAYVNYQLNDNIDIELTGTNLTDEYYIDPLTRSAIPAPGRTFKLGLTGRF